MTNHNPKRQISILAIDLSKHSFQLHGVDAQGQCVFRKKLPRAKLLPFIANLPPCMIAIEACGGANHWLRKFSALGHVVQMIAPQFVKPFVKSNKSDAADAEAICEAALLSEEDIVKLLAIREDSNLPIGGILVAMGKLTSERRNKLLNEFHRLYSSKKRYETISLSLEF